MWVAWVHIYCKIPYKYHGKQSVSGKVGVLLRNTAPQYLSFDIPVSRLKGKLYTKTLNLFSSFYFNKEVGQFLLLQLQNTQTDTETALEGHTTGSSNLYHGTSCGQKQKGKSTGLGQPSSRTPPCVAHWTDEGWDYIVHLRLHLRLE